MRLSHQSHIVNVSNTFSNSVAKQFDSQAPSNIFLFYFMKFGVCSVKYFIPGAKVQVSFMQLAVVLHIPVCKFMEDTRGSVDVKCRDISPRTAVDRVSEY